MDEAGCERRRHAVDDNAVTLAVAAGDQRRALGELVFPNLPVEHQLIHGGLPHLHRRRQFLQVDEPAAGIVREPDLRPADSRTPAPSGLQACFCRRWRYRVRHSAGCLPRYAFAPGGREPLPLDLAETRAKLAGTSRWNEHRDDRARGRLQNPLAQNDVRTGKPIHRWEARWNKWKGQPGTLSATTKFFA